MDNPRTELPLKRSKRLRSLQILMAENSVEGMRARWRKHKPLLEHRIRDWPPMILLAMRCFPERVADILRATAEKYVTPRYTLENVVCFVGLWNLQQPESRRKEEQAKLTATLLDLFRLDKDPGPWSLRLPQWVIGTAVSTSSPETVVELYSELRRIGAKLHLHTRVNFAFKLAALPKHKETALRILEDLLQEGVLDPSDLVANKLASKLFFLPVKEWEEGLISETDIASIREVYKRFPGLGITPNHRVYTAMIRSLALTDQLDKALDVYTLMRRRKMILDPLVLSTLVNGAKRANALSTIIDLVADAPTQYVQTRYTWNDIIHAILVAAIQENNERMASSPRVIPAYFFMLRAYAKLYKLEPLQTLLPPALNGGRLADRDDASEPWEWEKKADALTDMLPALPGDQLMEPNTDILNIMLLGYVSAFSSPKQIMNFYSHFRSLLRNRHPITIDLLSWSTIPYDIIIKVLTEHPDTMRTAIDIANDMLQDAADSSANPKPLPEPEIIPTAESTPDPSILLSPSPPPPEKQLLTSRLPSHPSPLPPPSVHTWSILLRGFIQHGRLYHAQRLILVMRQHGVEPNLATYNTLLYGYARAGKMRQSVLTISNLEAAGYHWDVHTVRGLARLAQRGKDSAELVAKLLAAQATKDAKARQQALHAAGEFERLAYKERMRRLPPLALVPEVTAAEVTKVLAGGAEQQQQQQQQPPRPPRPSAAELREQNTREEEWLEFQEREKQRMLEKLQQGGGAAGASAAESASAATAAAAGSLTGGKKKMTEALAADDFMQVYDELVLQGLKEELRDIQIEMDWKEKTYEKEFGSEKEEGEKEEAEKEAEDGSR
ncbi:hypothetical protein N0V88_000985 [Collariella sp. IMI 366227]|nr:hypothetical protein N0V88_000985 [Collariella sp. IMI 366227]